MTEATKPEQLQKRIASLESEIRRLKRKPGGAVGLLLLILGLVLLALATIFAHNVSAFIGIALTFWGALLLYVRPTQLVRKEVLEASSIEPIRQLAELVDGLGFKGTPFHVSPRTLIGMRRAQLVIPRDPSTTLMEENISADEFTVSSDFIAITPPGQELSSLLETELRTNFSTRDLDYVRNNLEKALIEGLEMAESFEMDVHESSITTEIKGSIFYDMAEKMSGEGRNPVLFDPLTSAVACILARVTQKRVMIEKIEREPKTKTVRTIYRLF